MAVNSRAKGKREELATVHMLRGLGYADAQRGQQRSGRETADIVCDSLPNVHMENKGGYRLEKLDVQTSLHTQACEQAERDAAERGVRAWCVIWRPLRHRQWRISFVSDTGHYATECGPAAIRARLELLNGGTSCPQ